tara:strand:+ start:314 stop:505 length:192 start_codon:yes stop_codon:yes gene_type:complete
MISVTMFGFIIIGKCINNEMILKLNEYSILSIIMIICIIADLNKNIISFKPNGIKLKGVLRKK